MESKQGSTKGGVHLAPDSKDLDIEVNGPYMVFKGLTVEEMEELRDDITLHLDLDRATPTHVEYWKFTHRHCGDFLNI
ncbi:hypothetical protein RJT34_22614 [Clitoria ternatea]|uniref:Splicing factor cactin central domain-containing protein n=1 Tax=Clitoria ternatea TaxID=43366 RepID=A0AAN9IGG2_CLITE